MSNIQISYLSTTWWLAQGPVGWRVPSTLSFPNLCVYDNVMMMVTMTLRMEVVSEVMMMMTPFSLSHHRMLCWWLIAEDCDWLKRSIPPTLTSLSVPVGRRRNRYKSIANLLWNVFKVWSTFIKNIKIYYIVPLELIRVWVKIKLDQGNVEVHCSGSGGLDCIAGSRFHPANPAS